MTYGFKWKGPHHPKHIDFLEGGHDGWGHLHWTVFCLSFPKIYDHRVLSGKIDIKNLPVFGGHSWSSRHSWWWSWCLRSPPLNWISLKVSKHIGYLGSGRKNYWVRASLKCGIFGDWGGAGGGQLFSMV